jgi:chaperone required for assembly of F1-ATPase
MNTNMTAPEASKAGILILSDGSVVKIPPDGVVTVPTQFIPELLKAGFTLN